MNPTVFVLHTKGTPPNLKLTSKTIITGSNTGLNGPDGIWLIQ